jgi:uncharacterized Zn finger protein
METGIKKQCCGQCGNTKHEVYTRPNGEIIIECLECESQTQITLTPAKIDVRNNAGLGTLCDYEF